MMPTKDLFSLFLQYALWGDSQNLNVEKLSHEQYMEMMRMGREQAVMGLFAQTLIDNNVKLESNDVFDIISLIQSIKQTNEILDKATAKICRMMDNKNIRILVVKGQTLAPYYRLSNLRQCGDVDFLCHPEDMEKAVTFLRDDMGVTLNAEGSNKHASFEMDGVKYEIHRTLTNFACHNHQRYWEKVFMKEVWQQHYTVNIGRTDVPSLPPTYNAIYVFVHIMFHLIVDGIGIRQFCDWAMILDKDNDNIDKTLLKKHLEGIGLLKAFIGLGTILTDYLGLPKEKFPFNITDNDHRNTCSMVNNIFLMGNFGHNIEYRFERGALHALEHAVRIGKQGCRFYIYAPKEVLMRIPYFMRWWGIRILGTITPYRYSQNNVFSSN